jgi:hypothetical protein
MKEKFFCISNVNDDVKRVNLAIILENVAYLSALSHSVANCTLQQKLIKMKLSSGKLQCWE